jgi:hypothetical protein
LCRFVLVAPDEFHGTDTATNKPGHTGSQPRSALKQKILPSGHAKHRQKFERSGDAKRDNGDQPENTKEQNQKHSGHFDTKQISRKRSRPFGNHFSFRIIFGAGASLKPHHPTAIGP